MLEQWIAWIKEGRNRGEQSQRRAALFNWQRQREAKRKFRRHRQLKRRMTRASQRANRGR